MPAMNVFIQMVCECRVQQLIEAAYQSLVLQIILMKGEGDIAE